MNRSLHYFLLIIILFSSLPALAQDEFCSQNLEEAQLRYDEGRIQDIEGLVLKCLNDKSYDKAQSVQALRLLILSYIFMGEEGRADTTMLRLLERSHEFTPDQALDPVEFINLYSSYRTKPIFRIGVKGGPNMSAIQATKLYTTGQPGDVGEFEYSSKQGVSVGLLFEYEFSPRWTIYPELLYSSRTLDNAEEFSALTVPGEIVDKKEETENHVWFELPVSVQYRFLDGNIRPYANVGGSVAWLNSAEFPSSQNRLVRQSITIQNTLGDVTPERNQLNFYAFLGGGVKLKLGEGYFVAEVRANYGITEVSTGEYSFRRNHGTAEETQQIDDQIPQRIVSDAYKMHYATFTIGYTMNFYNPKKL